ncbi:TonB-dependent receptor [Zhongshania sp.]|uniref:TonB-dependent receptor n=1 Tax=Zhongshania sp. TaxID=1971902 RepID=UPI003566F45F
MEKHKPLAKLSSLALCVGLAIQGNAFAQEKVRTGQLEEVIVTANKREQNVQDVPMAITAMSRTFLEDNGIGNVEDLAKMVPSVQFSTTSDPSTSVIRVRGVGTAVLGISVESNVSVVIDNVPLARTEMTNFEFADLERIEVLRGPQGTLFGKNSTAGLIHVISRDPAPEFEAFVNGSVETYETYAGGSVASHYGVSGPLTDTLSGRLTGFVKRTEGFYIDALNDNRTGPNNDSWGARGKLMWTPSEDLVVRLSYETNRLHGATTPIAFRSANPDKAAESPEIPYGPENRTTKTFGNDRSDTRSDGYTLSADWTLGQVVLTSVTGWRDYSLRNLISLPDLEGDTVDVTDLNEFRTTTTFTQELRLAPSEPGALDWTVGTLWFDNKTDQHIYGHLDNVPAASLALVGSPADPLVPVLLGLPPFVGSVDIYTNKITAAYTQNFGTFAQATWHMSDVLHLTGGVRHIWEQQDAYAYNKDDMTATGVGGPPIETISGPVSATIEDEDFVGTLSLQFDIAEDSNLYGTVSTGYRGGAIDVQTPPSDFEKSFANPVNAETAFNIEVGSKSRFFDNALQLNIALFRTVFSDFQAQVFVPPSATDPGGVIRFTVQNAGELQTQGVEIDLQAQPTESLFVAASLLYNEAIFNDFNPQCFTGQQPGEAGGEDVDGNGTCDTQDASGKTLANAPKLSLSLSTRYSVPLSDTSSGYAQLSGRWQDDVQFNTTQDPLTIQEAYGIWDLRLGWVGLDDRLELSAYVKNLLDQFSVQSMVNLSVVNDRRDIAHFISSDANRQFGISAGYSW